MFIFVCVCEDRLCVCVWAYVLMYVKRLVFVCVCEGCSYLCVFVKIDCVFVLGLMYLVCMYVCMRGYTQTQTVRTDMKMLNRSKATPIDT